MAGVETLDGGICLCKVGEIVDRDSEGGSQKLILAVDLVHLIDTGKLDPRNAKALFHVLCGEARFWVQNQVEIRLGHLQIFVKCLAPGDFPDVFETEAAQNLVELAVVLVGGERAEEVHARAALFALFEERIEGLANGHHRRRAALACQGIHVAGQDRQAGGLLGLAADAVHVRSEQGIDAGDAEHDDRGRRFAGRHDLLHGFRDFFQMPSGHDVGLVHEEEEEPPVVLAALGEERGVAAAAARRDDEHHGAGDGEAGAFDAEALRARRVERERRGGAVDEVPRG